MNTVINKAVVSLLGGAFTLLAEFGIEISWATDGMVAAIGMLITTLLVYLIPNKTPVV